MKRLNVNTISAIGAIPHAIQAPSTSGVIICSNTQARGINTSPCEIIVYCIDGFVSPAPDSAPLATIATLLQNCSSAMNRSVKPPHPSTSA